MCCANWFRYVPILFAGAFLVAEATQAATRTWVGGNNNWDSSTANWSPADEPDSNDDAVFNTPDFVTMTINQTLEGLTLSNGASLSTGTQSLMVNGTIDLDGLNTSLTVHTNSFLGGTPPLVSVNADDIMVTGGAEFFMANDVTLFDTSTSGGSDSDTVGVFTVGAGSRLAGNGRLLLNNSVSSPTVLFRNNGSIDALTYGNPGFVTAATLTLDAPDTESRIDLDGTSGAGTVNVFRSQTLDMNIRQNDDFDGTINVFAASTLDFQFDWLLNGTMNVQSGFIAGNPPFNPDQPAGIAVVAGGTVTMSESDSRINVVHDDGTLQFDAPLVANDGVIDNNGHLIFNADATIGSGVDFFMEFSADLTVNATVTVNDADWNWDDNGGSNNDITINDNGTLNANITAAGASVWNGDMHINGGTLNVQGDNNNWEQVGQNVLFEGTSLGVIGGDKFILTNGTVRAESGANGDITASTKWDGGTLDVDGELELIGSVEWAGTSVIGSGVLEQEGNATVTASTTIAVATYDWDQSSTTINPGITLTVDVDNIDRSNDTFNSNSITVNGGTLLVTVADGSWTLGSGGTLNLSSPGAQVALVNGAGSDMVVASGGVINASAADARVVVPLTMQTGSEIRLSGTAPKFRGVGMIFNGGDVTDPSGNGTFETIGMTVTGDSTISASRFIWDLAATTVEPTGSLTIDVDDFGADNSVDGVTITMNSGDINFGLTTLLQMNGGLRMNNTANDAPVLSGGSVVFGGNIDVGGVGDAEISSGVSFVGTPTVDVEAGARLIFTGNLVLLGAANFTGEGAVAFDATTTTVTNALTIEMPNGTFDLDGDSLGGDTFNIQAPLTLNIGALENGLNQFDLDTLAIGSNGSLTVELPGSNSWVMNGVLDLDGTTGADNFAIQLAGEKVELRGTVNVTDQSQLDANLDITGEINIAAGGNLRVNGNPAGNQFVSPIRLSGGVINGPGTLSIDNSRSLVGFGTINADLAFSGPNPGVFADNGELIINGALLDLGGIGTQDDDGILNVTNAWTTDSAGGVELNGGELRGATVTVDGSLSFEGIVGHGLIAAPVINENLIVSSGGPLTLRYLVGATDLDGTSDSGVLSASFSDFTLRAATIISSPTDFHGAISAFNAGTFTVENMSLDFTASSELSLNNGTFRPTRGADTQGTVTVEGVSTIDATTGSAGFSWESGSATTLNGDLQLLGRADIEQGASFAGAGTIINQGRLTIDDGGNVGVGIRNEDRVLLGPQFSIAQVFGANFEQIPGASTAFELAGADPGQFDQLLLTGDATLGGFLFLNLLGGFNPALGDTFTVLTAANVNGTFVVDTTTTTLDPGLAWEVIYNPNAVQLRVVANLTADADLDGDVDGADFLIIQRTNPALIPDWQAEYGLQSGPLQTTSTAVPEPTTQFMLLLAIFGSQLWGRMHRRRS